MALTEEQLAEARTELLRREKEIADRRNREYAEKVKRADDAFWERMTAKYPDIDRDTLYDIWSEIDDWYR